MKKASEYAMELVEGYANGHDFFMQSVKNCLGNMLFDEFTQLRDSRNIKFDNGLVPIVKELRAKWLSVCLQFNKATNTDRLELVFFDRAFKSVFQDTTEWYNEKILSV